MIALCLAALPASFTARAGVTMQCADLGQFGADCSVAELADADGASGHAIVIDGIRFARIAPGDLPGSAISSRIRVVPLGAGSSQPGLRFEADGDALAAPARYAIAFRVDSPIPARAIDVAEVRIGVQFDPAAGAGEVSGTFATADLGQIDQLVQFAEPPRSGFATLPASLQPANGSAPDVESTIAVNAGALLAFEQVVTLGGVLEVTKAAAMPVVNVGYNLEYLVTVSNASLPDLTAVTLRDPLPAGIIFQSAVPSQGDCVWDGTEVQCDLGELIGAASSQIALSGLAPLVTGAIVNTATGDSSQTGPAAAVETVVVREAVADLGVSVGDSPDPVAPGGETVYTIEVGNAGPGNATGTVLTVTLPPDAIPFRFTATPHGSCNRFANLVTCQLGTIGPDDVTTGLAVVELFVILPVAGLFTTTAVVDAVEPDPGGEPNQATEDTLVVVPGLVVGKSDSIDPVNAGDRFAYLITVTNNRGVPVTGAVLTDTLPAGVALIAATPDQGSCVMSGVMLACDLGDILPGLSVQVRLDVEAPPSTGVITNSAAVISDSDPVPIVGIEETTILPAIAELSLTTTAGPDPVLAGDEVTWTHRVTNGGPGNANNVVLIDDLPPDAGFTRVNAGLAVVCDHAAGRVTCSVGGARPGVLRPGESAMFGIAARPAVAGTAVNLAAVSADEPDPGALPNDTSTGVTVMFPPDLRISDSVNLPDDLLLDFGVVAAGAVVTGDLIIANLGGQGVTVAVIAGTPQPPFGLSDPGACLGSSLPGGASCTLAVTFSPTGAGLYADRFDLDFGSFRAPIDLTGESPAGLADLSLQKTSDRIEILVPGETFTFTLTVRNAGPDAAAVEVRDKLPRGLQIPAGLRPVPSLGTYDPPSGMWDVGALARGQTETLVVIAEQEKGFTGCVTNRAEARLTDSAQADPNPADNADQIDLGVGGCTDLAILDIAGDFLPTIPRRARWIVTFGMLGPGSAVQGPFAIELRLPNGAGFEDLALTGEQVVPLTCQGRGQQVRCAGAAAPPVICGPLQGFALCQAVITATAPRPLAGPLAVAIESATPDPVPNNNRAQFDGP